MSAQADARADLTTLLESLDLTVKDNPKNVNPWCVVIASANPVLVNDNTMGTTNEYDYNLLLQCVGGSPETSSLPALEDVVEKVIIALGASDFEMYPGDASAPFVGDGGDGKYYLTISLPVRIRIQLNGGS